MRYMKFLCIIFTRQIEFITQAAVVNNRRRSDNNNKYKGKTQLQLKFYIGKNTLVLPLFVKDATPKEESALMRQTQLCTVVNSYSHSSHAALSDWILPPQLATDFSWSWAGADLLFAPKLRRRHKRNKAEWRRGQRP